MNAVRGSDVHQFGIPQKKCQLIRPLEQYHRSHELYFIQGCQIDLYSFDRIDLSRVWNRFSE